MPDLVKKKGAFPPRVLRFCTQELKVLPIKKFISDFREAHGVEPINVVGIRAEESLRRSKFLEWEDGGPMGCDTWRPLIDWLVGDVIEIHSKHNVPPCPLYLRENNPASRVGCYPCIMSRKKEILAVSTEDSWRIDEIRGLEKEVGDALEARLAKKGETLESAGRERPSFFQARLGTDEKSWPIDKVVEWAKTSRGGRQFEMFHTSEPGCQMWGLCDIGDASPDDDSSA